MIDKEGIIYHLNRYAVLDDKAAAAFFEYAEYARIKKNKFLCVQGDSSNLVLITNGCLMTYFEDEKGNQTVIQFGTNMWWTGDLYAFSNSKPTDYSIKAMMDTETLSLSFENFNKLCEQHPVFERVFRIIFQNSLVSHGKRIVRNLSFTAEEKYEAFQKSYPRIENIVPQRYIASYLGITSEFLSKLRNRIAHKK